MGIRMKLTYNCEGNGVLYLQIMKAICGDTSDKSMADLGCHTAPYTAQLGFKERTYIDIQDRGLDFKEEEKYFVNQDIMDFLIEGKHYDVLISSDSIEHFSKEDGEAVLELMQLYSNKQIIFTPLGAYNITKDDNPDSHRSGWYPKDFKGWASIVLPNFHPSLNTGAFFVWHCENIEQDFKRVKNELKSII